MKIRKSKMVLTEVGPLTGLLRLPAGGRRRIGLHTVCDACGRSVKDDYFLCGFIENHHNVLLHEACVSEADKARLLSLEVSK